MDLTKFDDIRPYNDSEVHPALERIVANPLFSNVAQYLFPGQDENMFRQLLLSCNSKEDFQVKVMSQIVAKILQGTAKELTFSGLEHFKGGKKHLIVSNHRDIVLDSAIIQLILHQHGVETTEIAVGDNLITSSFIEDITRSNKMIKVIRSSNPREVYTTSKVLSEYIRYNVANQKSSVWIAQRNGRTKDGIDVTEQGLLKMFDMSGSGDFVKDFAELSILPTSISYEFEPCDIQKSVEMYVSRRQKYVKAEGEDLKSILTGIMQPKGNIHIAFNEPVSIEEIQEASQLDKNEKFKAICTAMDRRIVAEYKLWGNNYIAYDMLNATNEYASMYTAEQKAAFEGYMAAQLASVKLSDIDMVELKEIFLSIYANPVVGKKNL
ncbi:MAG: 1-acyl-sn-glycerol-3-phosphate acyltransferase [Bacteroidales bacterium]|nr:1-acyl-sn-glycerol-3-phosphate acyltransferase [Bacteroidales bacterium]